MIVLKSPPPKWWAFFTATYLQTHPGIGQSAVFGQSFLEQFAEHVVLWCSFLAGFTPPAKAVVESNDIARSEKNKLFILLILIIEIIIFVGMKLYLWRMPAFGLGRRKAIIIKRISFLLVQWNVAKNYSIVWQKVKIPIRACDERVTWFILAIGILFWLPILFWTGLFFTASVSLFWLLCGQ